MSPKKKKKKYETRKIVKRAVSNPYMLNCFKYFLIYILRQNVSKKLYKKICQKNYIKSLCAKLF